MTPYPKRLPVWLASIALAISPAATRAQDATAAKATFDAVNKHLDLGGQVYGFINVQGDYAALAKSAQDLYEKILQMGEGMLPIPEGIDVAGLLLQLGFDNVEAIGLSSIKYGQGYRSRFFARIDGQRKGLLRLSGGKPQPFEIGSFAPASSLVALEWNVDLSAVKDTLAGIGAELEKFMGADPLVGALATSLPGTESTVEDLLAALNGKLMGYALADETATLAIPDLDVELPGIDVVLVHQSGRELYEIIENSLAANAPPDLYSVETRDGVTQLIFNLQEEDSLGFYMPLLQIEDGSDHLLIASRPEALETLTEGDRLAENADFKRFAALLPKEGTSFSFLSKKGYGLVKTLMTHATTEEGLDPASSTLNEALMKVIYGEPQPGAGVLANWEDGIYLEGFSSTSYKSSFLSPVVFAAAQFFALRRVQAEAQELEFEIRPELERELRPFPLPDA